MIMQYFVNLVAVARSKFSYRRIFIRCFTYDGLKMSFSSRMLSDIYIPIKYICKSLQPLIHSPW